MTLPFIPFDIWKSISEFVPDEQLKRIGGVNRELLDISREVSFRDVEAVCWDKKTKERLRALG